MITNVKFAKVHPNAIIPSKRDEDMGFDIYACFDEDYIVINPHETKLIPTGIASACNPEYGFLLRERGSTGSKGIALRAGVIDSGYRNEWFVGLTNTTDRLLIISKVDVQDIVDSEKHKLDYNYNIRKKYIDENISHEYLEYIDKKTSMNWIISNALIYPYSKAIAQALVVPVPKVEIEEISYDKLKEIKSERGMGALGSSNK